MTLRETEETLRTLATRHPGLDEAMLITLLRAGGWEEKQIDEAKAIWKAGVRAVGLQKETASVMLPSMPEVEALPSLVDGNHLLSAHNEEPEEKKITVMEPQSLVTSAEVRLVDKKEELPHNLPLRPFETSEHIWPFSRYRDVFYGDIFDETISQTAREAVPLPPVEKAVETPISIPEPALVVQEKSIEQVIEKRVEVPVAVPEVYTQQVKLSGGDEKLVMMAGAMLLVILLLLGYMYSNGRL